VIERTLGSGKVRELKNEDCVTAWRRNIGFPGVLISSGQPKTLHCNVLFGRQ
jgi:hypothetical protein